MMKSNSVMSTEVNASIQTVTWTFQGIGEITLHLERVHADNIGYAALHGFKQRCGDAAALGMNASRQDKFDAIRALVDHYETGTADWRQAGATRTSGGELGLLVQCLMQLQTEKTREELVAWAKSKTPAQRAALMLTPRVKVLADAIREAQASDAGDVDGLLGELDIEVETQDE